MPNACWFHHWSIWSTPYRADPQSPAVYQRRVCIDCRLVQERESVKEIAEDQIATSPPPISTYVTPAKSTKKRAAK